MAKTNQSLVDRIILDLSIILNTDFTSADETIERLGGLLVQPTSVNSQQYQTSVGYFVNNGASKAAAENLALIVANLSKISNVSVGKIIRQIEGADDITFTEDFYISINSIRSKESQWFKATTTYNDRVLHRVGCNCPAPSNLVIHRSDTHAISNFVPLTFTVYESTIELIARFVLYTTTLYPVDIADQMAVNCAFETGTMTLIPFDSADYGVDQVSSQFYQTVWYHDAGPWEDFAKYSVDQVSSQFYQTVWYYDAGPWEDAAKYSVSLISASLINKLVTVDTPDEELQLGCTIRPEACSMTPV